ncbi:MAG: PAS domain S-box protein [Actinomycetota bacterium]
MQSAMCSVEGIIRGTDAPFAEIHGFQPEELAGSPITAVIAPHCRDELPLHILIACSRGTHDFPSVHRNRSGEEFPVQVAMRLESGRVRYEVRDPS